MSNPRVGTELAGYRLESVIARGGMSTVFLAENLRLSRKVAVKILSSELAEDDRFRERFVRESKIAAALDHPNIIPIYEAGEADGMLFIAMRYVDGPHLKSLIQQVGPLPPLRLDPLISQTGSALDAAHNRGLIHRDVKPGNILTDPQMGPSYQDHVYLCDFGLTKQVSSHSGLTRTGQFVGTIDYIAPEQIEGNEVDYRTDLYSLGCVLYECITGEVPFRKSTEAAVIWAHVQEDPAPVSAIRPDLPRAVDEVIAKAMAKDPTARYSSCHELVTDLRRAFGGTRTATVMGRGDTRGEGTREPVASVAAAEAPATGAAVGAPTVAGRSTPAEGATASATVVGSSSPEAPAISPGTRGDERRTIPNPVVLLTVVLSLVIGAVGGWLIGHRGSTTPGTMTAAGDSVYNVMILDHVPSSYSSTCHQAEAAPPPGAEQLPDNLVFAVARCTAPGQIAVDLYLVHATASMQVGFYQIAQTHQLSATPPALQRLKQIRMAAMNAAIQFHLDRVLSLAPRGASCGTTFENGIADVWARQGDIGHAEGAGGQLGGLVGCYRDRKSGLFTIVWTDSQTTIMGVATGSQVNDLYKWWMDEAGPEFNPYMMSGPGMSPGM